MDKGGGGSAVRPGNKNVSDLLQPRSGGKVQKSGRQARAKSGVFSAGAGAEIGWRNMATANTMETLVNQDFCAQPPDFDVYWKEIIRNYLHVN
jgi:hypothetical protein